MNTSPFVARNRQATPSAESAEGDVRHGDDTDGGKEMQRG